MIICKLCGDTITEAERWEYVRPYPVGTPEAVKERVHSSCVAQLAKDTIKALAQVPEAEQGE